MIQYLPFRLMNELALAWNMTPKGSCDTRAKAPDNRKTGVKRSSEVCCPPHRGSQQPACPPERRAVSVLSRSIQDEQRTHGRRALRHACRARGRKVRSRSWIDHKLSTCRSCDDGSSHRRSRCRKSDAHRMRERNTGATRTSQGRPEPCLLAENVPK